MNDDLMKNETISTDQARSKRVEMIVRQLESLPTLPVVATKVLQATTAKETSIREVISLIESDQSLTAKILGITKKADLGLGDSIQTVGKAVVMLGFEAIRNAVLSVQVFETFGKQDATSAADESGTVFKRQEFWKHSLAVACVAQLIAESLPDKTKIDKDDVFVCGLLHDLGKVALDTCLPKSFARVAEIAVNNRTSIADVERRILGMDHAAIGKRLAENWHLPEPIVNSIWLHHHKSNTLPEHIEHRELIDVIHLADLITREQRIGFSGNFLFAQRSEPMAQRMGIKSDAYQKILLNMRNRMGERASLIGLDEISSEQLYQQALQGANSELGRLNQSLTVMNRRLNSRSRYFEAINDLNKQLNPEMSVVEILEQAVKTVQTALDVTTIVVFRQDANNRFVESALADQDNISTKLFELPEAFNENSDDNEQANDGFLIEPSSALAELIANYSAELSPHPVKVIKLKSQNVTIGGILISADSLLTDRLTRERQEIDALCTALGLAIGQSAAIENKDRMTEELLMLTRQMQELEEKFIEVRCVAAIGELAAGAAHEMNNPLAIISGRAQILQDQEPDLDKSKALEVIVSQATRASEIITELMDFAKPVKPKRKQVNVNDLFKFSINEISEQHKLKPSQIHVDIKKGADSVYCDKEQLESSLKEILTNAVEASKPGTLEIKLQAILEDNGEFVQIRVEDNGSGMESDILNRALDPFFSARPAGRGRGLGLSRAYRYIQSNNGNLWLESTQDVGTTAFMRIPRKRGTGKEAKGQPLC